MSTQLDDLEKGPVVGSPSASLEQGYYKEDQPKVLNVFNRFNAWMEKMGGETRGIERVPEDERHDDSYWNSASMWLGGNLVIAAFALGGIGITIFEMTFWDSVLVIIFFTLLGCLPTAYFSTFGPPSGLRQMVLGRYWFGYQGVRIAAFINCVSCVGWTAVNTMASANVLHQINDGSLPNWGGIIVVAIASWLISLFGYRVVHAYEKWAWIPNFAVFIVIAARMGMSKQFEFGTLGTGSMEAASCLSFGSAIFGFAAGWSPYASDYTSYKPVTTNRIRCFIWVMVGEAVPVIFACIMGAAVSTGTLKNAAWLEASNEYSTGGLLRMCLVENSLHGFGQFCMVVLSLSTIANNIPNLYTFALSAQGVWSVFAYIPSYLWTTLCTGIAIAISIPGIKYFESFLGNFMNIIAYWVAFHAGIIASEHFIYRKGLKGYNFDVYNNAKKMGVGYAPVLAGCCGVAGAALGMAQPWFIGPIGKLIGDPAYGGDIGFELAFAFAFIVDASTRWIENKYDGAGSYPHHQIEYE